MSKLTRSMERVAVRALPSRAARVLGGAAGFLVRPRRSYSQYGEDLVLETFFEGAGIDQGVYVDIGAFHPRWLSNTHVLARRGWKGVVVDVDRDKVGLCERRRDCIGIVGAVVPSREHPTVDLYRFARLWSEIDTLSHEEAMERSARTGLGFTRHEVPAVPIDEVLTTAVDTYGRVDLMNIDVEGLDEILLEAVDLERVPVGVICFENNTEFGGSQRVQRLLAERSYLHVLTAGGSQVYARADLATAAGQRTGRR